MIKNYPLELIRNNRYQARQVEDTDYILALAESIRDTHGALQIPKGRLDPDKPGGVELALGHERLMAYRTLASGAVDGTDRIQWETMPVDVDELTDRQMWECGKFGSTDGHLLKAEIEDGWIVVDPPAPYVTCPDCVDKPALRKITAKPAKKAKRKK